MKISNFRLFPLFSIMCIMFCIAPSIAFGQWHPDSSQNTPVCDTIGQQDNPQGCTDGNNGAIIVWEDGRYGTYQIFAQHIDQNGRPRWNRNGLRLATVPSGNPSLTNPIITSDDNGGAYVVWTDSRKTDAGNSLYAQHVLANGTLAYPDSGLPVGIGLNGCNNPTLCDDGAGGAYVAWEDNRACDATTQPDIWMNRLWLNGVKYGLTTTGTQCTLTKNNVGTFFKPKYEYDFHDPNAHFKCYMIGLDLTISGKGSYEIASVLSDTQISLKTYPDPATYGAYFVGNLTGLPIDTAVQKQTGPSLVNDGQGGCFLAWTNSGTVPNSIYGTHLDSTCTALWDPAPQPGFQFYINLNTSDYSRNVTLNRDGNQLLLTWQVFNENNNSQEIYAQRMSCSTPMDTAFLWGSPTEAVDVSSDQIQNQITPQIFGDDSVVFGANGALVPFADQEPGSSTNYDIAMVRVLGDGSDLLPQSGNGFWFFEQKPNMHNEMQAVKITDPTNGGSQTGVLSVWDDAWDGVDTMIYAQRIDRTGKKYFPTPGTHNAWGLAISGNSPTKQWTAKQPCLIPRTDGGIVAWTDFRSGSPAIYCQLIRMDGSLWIPSDTTSPTMTVVSRTPSDDTSQCNSQCTTVLAIDPGTTVNNVVLKSPIDSLTPLAMKNMELDTLNFVKGSDTVSFSVCVIDSFQDGSGTVLVEDSALNLQTMSFMYCTIPDTSTPTITVDTLSTKPYVLNIAIQDAGPWDRGLRSITVSNAENVSIGDSNLKITLGEGSFDIKDSIEDLTQPATFSIRAFDVANNSTIYNFSYTPPLGVVGEVLNPISFSVFPNPTSGDATVRLDGAPFADVTVLDVLGRSVNQFHLEGSKELQTSSLVTGTYIVRAQIGDQVICKRIVKE